MEKFGLKLRYKYEHDGIHRRCLKVSTYEYDYVILVEICFCFWIQFEVVARSFNIHPMGQS